MAAPYVGEIRLVGFNFAPVDWAICNGAQLAISQFTTLYQLIGTTYGGNGQTTFGLPDLQGRTPLHQGQLPGGQNYVIGQTGGVETVTILPQQYPTHHHSLLGSSNSGTGASPGNNAVGGLKTYASVTPSDPMNANFLSTASGGSQPHENRQPFQVLNWIISLYGVYPSQS